jgi:hypothetical protein
MASEMHAKYSGYIGSLNMSNRAFSHTLHILVGFPSPQSSSTTTFRPIFNRAHQTCEFGWLMENVGKRRMVVAFALFASILNIDTGKGGKYTVTVNVNDGIPSTSFY